MVGVKIGNYIAPGLDLAKLIAIYRAYARGMMTRERFLSAEIQAAKARGSLVPWWAR